MHLTCSCEGLLTYFVFQGYDKVCVHSEGGDMRVREIAGMSVRGGEVGDQANATFVRDMSLALLRPMAEREADQKLLAQYGNNIPPRSCYDCGEPISAKRLQAKPSAVRCTACQEATES